MDELLRILEAGRTAGLLGPGPVEAHAAHARAFVTAADPPPSRFVDLGSGAGIPGLVCALAWPDAEGVLLDARRKRADFLEDAVVALGLEGRVEVLAERAEVVGRDRVHRGQYDLVTARSFGPPAVTAECAAPLLRRGGRLLVSEPPGAPEGRWPAPGLAELGLSDDGVVRTGEASVRVLSVVAAIADRWPRGVGTPAKRPLF